jgi:hypothetical protein
MTPQVRTRQIQYVHLIDLKLQPLSGWVRQPWNVEGLDEVTDVEVAEKAGVERGGESAAGRTARDDQ